MDDGRCLLDVINDPDALSQFMTSSQDKGLSLLEANQRFNDNTFAINGVQQALVAQPRVVNIQQQPQQQQAGLQYVVRHQQQPAAVQFMAYQQQQQTPQQPEHQHQPAVLINGTPLSRPLASSGQQLGDSPLRAAQPQLIYLSQPGPGNGAQQATAGQLVHLGGQPGTVGQPMRALVNLNQPGAAVLNIGQPGGGQQQVQLITSGGQLVAQAVPGGPGMVAAGGQHVQFAAINQQQLQVQQQQQSQQQQQQIQLRPALSGGQPQQQQQVQYVVQRALVNGVVQNIVLRAMPMQTMSAVPASVVDAQTQQTALVQQQQHVQVPIAAGTATAGMPMRHMLVELKPNSTVQQQPVSGMHIQQQQVAMVGGGNELQYRTLAVAGGRTNDGVDGGGLDQQQQQQQPLQQVNVMQANGEMRVITLTQDQLKQLIANNGGQLQAQAAGSVGSGVWQTQAQQQVQTAGGGGATVLQNTDGRFVLRSNQTVLGGVAQPQQLPIQQQTVATVDSSHTAGLLPSGIAVKQEPLQQQLQQISNAGATTQLQMLPNNNQQQAGVDGQQPQQKTSAVAQAIALLNPSSRLMLAKIRARIKELMSQATRTAEEDRVLQQLHDAQNKLLQSVKNIVQQRALQQQQQQQQQLQQQQLLLQQQQQQLLLDQQQQQQEANNIVVQQVRPGTTLMQPVINTALQQVRVIRPQERVSSPAPPGGGGATALQLAAVSNKVTTVNANVAAVGAVRFPKILPAIAPNNAPSPNPTGMRGEVQQTAPVVIALQQQPTAPASLPVIGSPPLASGQQAIKLTPQVKEWLQAQLMKLPPDARQELLANPAPLLAKLQQLRMAKDESERNKGVVLINGAQKDVKVEAGVRPAAVRPLTKQQLFTHQLTKDQQGALNPDCHEPFKSWPDVIKRMVRYHVFNTALCNPDDVQKMDDQLELHAINLLERKENLMERYRNLIYADSMKTHPLSETVMLERTFISSERELLKEERYIAQYAPDKFVPRPVLDKTQTSLQTTLNLLSLRNARESENVMKRHHSDDYDEPFGESVIKRHRSESDEDSEIYEINESSAMPDDDACEDSHYDLNADAGYQQQNDSDADASGAVGYEYDVQSLPRTQSNSSLIGYDEESYCPAVAEDDQPMAEEFDGHMTCEQPIGNGEEEADCGQQQWFDSLVETDETQSAINSILGFGFD